MKNKMQKALRLCNFRIDVVINDITGKSGRAIMEAILSGERDGNKLAQLANNRCRKSKKEIAEALQGHDDEELMFELEDCYDLYKIIQAKIDVCDKKIEQLLKSYLVADTKIEPRVKITQKQTKGKNQVKFDLPQLSYQYYGVDLFAIESVSMNTVLTLITEIGHGIYKFKTAKQFSSFLRLAPNNKVSGGKLISSRTPKGANKLSIALRNAANTIDNIKKGSLVSFFKRIAYKKGRAAAITATARKLAVIIWNMIVKKQEYKPLAEDVYHELIRVKVIKNIQHQMKKLNIVTNDLLVT
jgi:transposase